MVVSRIRIRSLLNSGWLRIAGATILCLLALWPALAMESPESDSGPPPAEVLPEPARPLPTPDSPAKTQALSFAFVMLAGIIVGGAMLLALVVIWGNRTRRLARSPLPPVAPRDELWFLKPRKESGDEPGHPASPDLDSNTDPGEN